MAKNLAQAMKNLRGAASVIEAESVSDTASANTTEDTSGLGIVGDKSTFFQKQLEQTAAHLTTIEIDIEKLLDNPFQYLARPNMDQEGLEGLADSIRQNGFYSTLLARRKKGKLGYYELAFGHRRREAAKIIGLKTLPVKILEALTDTQMARLMASENFAREDLTSIGEANVIGHLANEQNMSIPQIVEIVGKGRGWVELRLKLFNAPSDIKMMVEQRPETLGHIRLLEQLDEKNSRASVIEEIIKKGLTREQLQKRIDRLTHEPQFNPSTSRLDTSNNKIDNNFTNPIQYGDSEESNNQAGANQERNSDNFASSTRPDSNNTQFGRKRSEGEVSSQIQEIAHPTLGQDNILGYGSIIEESVLLEGYEAIHESVVLLINQVSKLELITYNGRQLVQLDAEAINEAVIRLQRLVSSSDNSAT